MQECPFISQREPAMSSIWIIAHSRYFIFQSFLSRQDTRLQRVPKISFILLAKCFSSPESFMNTVNSNPPDE